MRLLQLLLFFGPGLLAVLWAARENGGAGVRALLRGVLVWRVPPAWYVAVLAGPLAVNLVALLVARALGVENARLPGIAAALLAFVPAFGAYLLLNTEELAWRGYAWPRLRDRMGALRASIVLGAIWGVLHAPLFLMRGGHPGGWPPALFLVMTVAFSVLFALTYEGTRGSILLVHLLHQALNAWGDAVPIYPRATQSTVPALVAVGIAIAVAIVASRRAGWSLTMPAAGARGADDGVEVVRFRPELRADFERLNRQWIEQYFEIEEPDRALFRDPEGGIVRPGGEIFFVLAGGRALGTCAMVPHGEAFELAKMAVAPEARGRGYGDRLMEAALAFARERDAGRVELFTSSRLAPALKLYEKHGFVRVPAAPHEGGYARADVKMVLDLRPAPAHRAALSPNVERHG